MESFPSERNTKEQLFPQSSDYPYEEYIMDIHSDSTTDQVMVNWEFPNQERVQILFHTEDNAELLFVSPSIVLTEEGEDGHFYTLGEVELFLSKIKNDIVA